MQNYARKFYKYSWLSSAVAQPLVSRHWVGLCHRISGLISYLMACNHHPPLLVPFTPMQNIIWQRLLEHKSPRMGPFCSTNRPYVSCNGIYMIPLNRGVMKHYLQSFYWVYSMYVFCTFNVNVKIYNNN